MSQQRRSVSTGGGNYVGTIRGRATVGDIVAGDKYSHDTHVHAPHYTLGVTGRILVISGLLIAFAGMVAFGYPAVQFFMVIFGALQAQSDQPPDLSSVAFMPFLPLGLGMTMAGTLMMFLGVAFVRRAR
jgi:hypothetical protein